MLFHEIYGVYYNILSDILAKAVSKTLTVDSIETIIREKGFQESILTIPQNLKNQTWPFLKSDLSTPLENTPMLPLTTLQKRWMKALLQDPRIQLFNVSEEGLEDVEPLYPVDIFVYFDQSSDGDPFNDPQYKQNFQMILTALREKRWLRIRFVGRNGIPHVHRCIPYGLEYSSKDDKFRMITANKRSALCINVGRIVSCELLEPCIPEEYRPKALRKHTLTAELTDQRNALERVMIHFSHYEKEVVRLDDHHYLLKLHYEKDDETELLIRVLSFGLNLKVIAPDSFREKLKDRIEKQIKLRTQR